jgi:hypothetical protein
MNNTLELPKMTHENESRPKANHGDLKKLNSDNGIWLPISYGLRGYRGKSLRFRTNDWIKKKGFIFPDGFFLIPQRNQPSFKLIDPNLLNSFEFNLKKTLISRSNSMVPWVRRHASHLYRLSYIGNRSDYNIIFVCEKV